MLLLHLNYFQNHLKDGNNVSSSSKTTVMWTLLNNKIKIFENINKTNKILLILLFIYYIVEIIVTSTHQTSHVLLLHCV